MNKVPWWGTSNPLLFASHLILQPSPPSAWMLWVERTQLRGNIYNKNTFAQRVGMAYAASRHHHDGVAAACTSHRANNWIRWEVWDVSAKPYYVNFSSEKSLAAFQNFRWASWERSWRHRTGKKGILHRSLFRLPDQYLNFCQDYWPLLESFPTIMIIINAGGWGSNGEDQHSRKQAVCDLFDVQFSTSDACG